jgi:hypothetical protein
LEVNFCTLFHSKGKVGKVKGKVFALHAMKACRRSRGIAPLILNLGTRFGEGLTSRPDHFISGKESRYQFSRGLGGPQSGYGLSGEAKSLLTDSNSGPPPRLSSVRGRSVKPRSFVHSCVTYVGLSVRIT